MRTFDFSPLYRSTVGFDRLASQLDAANNDTRQQGYPPYNIERTGDDSYRITMAVAGFSENEISVEAQQNKLTITGKQENDEDKGGNYLHRGIATRSFQKQFDLADHVEVKGAEITNGLLHVELARELPEAMKPRQINIISGGNSQKIEATSAAA